MNDVLDRILVPIKNEKIRILEEIEWKRKSNTRGYYETVRLLL